jgi:hypothetical protein
MYSTLLGLSLLLLQLLNTVRIRRQWRLVRVGAVGR